jgi:hypothetical protein
MSAFSIDADFVILVIAALIALGATLKAFNALRAPAVTRAIFWFALAIGAAIVALFFGTFQIRLM